VPGRLSPDHRRVLTLLGTEFDGKATTRQLAEQRRRSVNGVSQHLGVLLSHGRVKRLGGKGGDTQWQAIQEGQMPLKVGG
jgi:hypothetical protein